MQNKPRGLLKISQTFFFLVNSTKVQYLKEGHEQTSIETGLKTIKKKWTSGIHKIYMAVKLKYDNY